MRVERHSQWDKNDHNSGVMFTRLVPLAKVASILQ